MRVYQEHYSRRRKWERLEQFFVLQRVEGPVLLRDGESSESLGRHGTHPDHVRFQTDIFLITLSMQLLYILHIESFLIPLAMLFIFDLYQILDHVLFFLFVDQRLATHTAFQIALLTYCFDDTADQASDSQMHVFRHPAQVDCDFVSK